MHGSFTIRRVATTQPFTRQWTAQVFGLTTGSAKRRGAATSSPDSSSSSESSPHEGAQSRASTFAKSAPVEQRNPASPFNSTKLPFPSGSITQADPYRLHAHCTKHNTILSLTRDVPHLDDGDVSGILQKLKSGERAVSTPVDSTIFGKTVARVTCGALGFKKAQRGTFEAATRTTGRMLELIEQVGSVVRKTKKDGVRVRDPPPTTIELIFKGFGPGREAVVAALQTDRGSFVRRMIKRVTDATPIKIGGTRPKKRRMLSPPLQLGRRRR
ncbi:MAG: hypothetical protein CYPHOPRED_000534 [Cyphobasidiales sp. Tagirdzhanova-0007]|nr:MAG: hypothetical protein CYPHOPRED_000534 [Cyphobasidiales sp. Tagirdzhanova-0007]